jgi:hypothetical protein
LYPIPIAALCAERKRWRDKRMIKEDIEETKDDERTFC